MNSKKFSPVLVVCVVLLTFSFTKITSADDVKSPPCVTCQGQPIQLDRIKAANATCRAELKDVIKLPPNPTIKDIKKIWKNSCFMACIWEKLGWIVNGAASPPGISTYITVAYPPLVRTTIIDGMNACAKISGTGLTKTDECKSYKPFSKCVKKLIKTTCKDSGATTSPVSGRRRRQADSSTDSDEDDDSSLETMASA